MASLPSAREVVAVAFRHRWSLLAAAILPIALGLAIPLHLTPQYEARTQVLVKPGREFMAQAESSGNMQLPQMTMREMVDTVTQILQSTDLIRDVLRDETVPKLYPDIARRLPPEAWNDAAGRALMANLSVAPVRLTNVIDMALRNADREVATEALRTILARFQERHVAAFSQRRSALLEAQLEENSRLLDTAQRARAVYVAERQLFSLPEQRNLLVQRRSQMSQELRELEMRDESLARQIGYVTGELVRQPETITVQVVNQASAVAEDAQRRLRELRQRERELLSTLGPHHPEMRANRAAIAATEQSLAQTGHRTQAISTGINPLTTTLRAQQAALESERTPLAGRMAALRAAIEEDDTRLRQMAEDEIGLRALDRRIAGLDGAIRALQQRGTEARFSEELDRAQVAGLSVIQQPFASERPVSPKRMLFLAGGVVAGGLLASLRLLLALSFGSRFLTVETVERMLGVPVLAGLPALPAPRQRLALPQQAAAPAQQLADASAPAAQVKARLVGQHLAADGRTLRVEWACGACGAPGTPQESMFQLPPIRCTRCGALNEIEADA
jgi:uncharacterized protein involved in exopolysaccharide biosynthesis/DNA-directed RNA polymerase subunit RPC12/RpoP